MNRLRTVFFTLSFIAILSLGVFSQTNITVEPAFREISNFTNVRDFTMNSKADEAYFTIQSPLGEISTIAVIKMKNGKWQKPEMVNFSGKFKDLEPFISSDGLKLYFVSNRPIDKSSSESKDFDIWFVTRKNAKSAWSTPQNLGSPVNTKDDEFYPTLSANGNIYFTKEKTNPQTNPDIMFSKWDGENFSTPVNLGDAINTEGHEYNSYIAPDESFLIFGGYRRKDGFGSGDLYISFRNKVGIWSKATNLGKDINSNAMDYCPFIDWNTKTLYFTSRRSSVEAKTFGSLNDFENEINKYENGLSKIYRVSIADKISKTAK